MAGSVLLHPRAIVFVIAGLIVSATGKKTFIKFSSGLVPVSLLVLGLLHVTHTGPQLACPLLRPSVRDPARCRPLWDSGLRSVLPPEVSCFGPWVCFVQC